MNRQTRHSLSIAALVALSLCQSVTARAQTVAPESGASAPASTASPAASGVEGDPVQVEVTTLREPIEFPYQRAYDAAVKVRDASHGNTDLVVSIIEKKPIGIPLRVSLQYGDTVEPLPVDPSNTFTVVPNPVALENNAILTANRHRGGLSVQVGLRPHIVPGATLTRAEINQLVSDGKAARKSLVPWYARIFLPTVNGVRLCSLDAGGRFALHDPAGTDQALATKDAKDLYDRPAHCVDLPPTRDAREAALAVAMPPDATVDFSATAF